MMPREGMVAVVTESTADLPPAMADELGITVVPLKMRIGERTYADGIDITTEQYYRMLGSLPTSPVVIDPTPSELIRVYTRLSTSTKSIVSLHTSSKLGGTYASAIAAREAVFARAQVEVIDSQSASFGLGFLAISAAQAARDGAGVREIANLVRRIIPHIHITFCVETLEYLQRSGRLERIPGAIGSVPNARPLLKVEDGEIHPVERVRTRAKALERIYEFIELFPTIDRMALMYTSSPEDAETLQRRIEPFVAADKVTVARTGPVLAAYLGPGAIGAIVDQGMHSSF